MPAGKSASIWAVLAASEGDFGPLADDPRWVAPASNPRDSVWSDDFSDLVPHLIGLKLDDQPPVSQTERDPAQIRDRFMRGMGAKKNRTLG